MGRTGRAPASSGTRKAASGDAAFPLVIERSLIIPSPLTARTSPRTSRERAYAVLTGILTNRCRDMASRGLADNRVSGMNRCHSPWRTIHGNPCQRRFVLLFVTIALPFPFPSTLMVVVAIGAGPGEAGIPDEGAVRREKPVTSTVTRQ